MVKKVFDFFKFITYGIFKLIVYIFDIKFLCFLVISSAFIFSTFGFYGAKVTRETLGLALMLLLIALFSDLKKFNFWGLTGEKNERDLKELAGKSGVDDTAVPKPNQSEVEKAEIIGNTPVQLMDANKGNFLEIAFNVERVMRIASTVLLGHDVPSNTTPEKVLKILKEKGLLTEVGVQQVESIRWLRNMLVHGRDGEVTEATIQSGIQIAWSLYNELDNWLKDPK